MGAKVNYKLDITIDGLPPLPNAMPRNPRARWAIAKDWRSSTKVNILIRGKKPQKPLEKASLTYYRYSSVEPDRDNLAASFKPIQDGLKDAGIIKDDAPKYIGMPDYRWGPVPRGVGKIRIIVEEVSPEQLVVQTKNKNGRHDEDRKGAGNRKPSPKNSSGGVHEDE